MPEQLRLIRSDQYSFIKQGIPAVLVKTGFESDDKGVDGGKIIRDWMQNRYHGPADDLTQAFRFDAGVRFAKVVFLVGWHVANDSSRPSWKADDFFRTKFAAPQ